MNGFGLLLTGLGLIALNAFFVMAEYALVSARRNRLETNAKKGSRTDALVLAALDTINRYVAGIQFGITVVGILIGAIIENPLTTAIAEAAPDVIPGPVITVLSISLIVFPLVVLGELVPKYITLAYPEDVARLFIRLLQVIILVLSPFIWLLEKSGQAMIVVLGKLGLQAKSDEASFLREELVSLLRSGGESGDLAEDHSDMVAKALKLDKLDAEDAMIHRLDIKWLPIDCSQEETLQRLREIPHSRIPVCRDDLDDVVGLVYLQDIIRALTDDGFNLAQLARPPIFVPENLTLDRLVNLMREEKTQVVIVQDEYGGTSGLVTLEDVVEEIFGDLEDALESERPAIEQTARNRLSVRPDVRYDELLDFLDLEAQDEEDWTTEPIAGILMEELGRPPRMGDTVDLPVGRLRVEAVAQNRVTRIGVYIRIKTGQEAS